MEQIFKIIIQTFYQLLKCAWGTYIKKLYKVKNKYIICLLFNLRNYVIDFTKHSKLNY